MALWEIIVLGYVANITIWIGMLVISFVMTLINARNEEYAKGFIVLVDILEDIKIVRDKLHQIGRHAIHTEVLVWYIPWTGVLLLLIFLNRLFTVGLMGHFHIELSKQLSYLENEYYQYK